MAKIAIVSARVFKCFRMPRLARWQRSRKPDPVQNALKDVERIERNLEKIEILMCSQFPQTHGEAYQKFLKLCEEEIEQDLASVETVLFGCPQATRSSHSDQSTEFHDLMLAYNNVSMKLSRYVE